MKVKTTTKLINFLIFAFLVTGVMNSQVVNAQGDAISESTVVLTCFQPPGSGPLPPCLLPVGIDAKFISPNPSGSARVAIFGDDTAEIKIKLEGLADDLVITAWVAYFFPGPGAPGPDSIFFATAGVSSPLAPTHAAFTEGLGTEPNRLVFTDSGTAKIKVRLDYNPLKAGQGPLRNILAEPNQGDAAAGSDAEQPDCCNNGAQPVGASYLRAFDANGFQELEADGTAKLLRSPLPVAFLAIVVHTDETTHGIFPGIPILPIPGNSIDNGDHFLLGLFDLRSLQQ